MQIVLYERDVDYIEVIASVLATESWRVQTVDRADELLSLVREKRFDLCLIDACLARDGVVDGQDSICQQIRQSSAIPIMVLTTLLDELQALRCLDEGADIYLLKPFSPRQLKVVARALVRRAAMTKLTREDDVLSVNDIQLSLLRREVTIRGSKVTLAPREFSLLHALLANRGYPLTRGQIARQAWGPEFDNADREVDVYIRRLRRKIEADPQNPTLLLTERGYGYRFRARESTAISA